MCENKMWTEHGDPILADTQQNLAGHFKDKSAAKRGGANDKQQHGAVSQAIKGYGASATHASPEYLGGDQHNQDCNMRMAMHLCDCPSQRNYPLTRDSYKHVVSAYTAGQIEHGPHEDTMKHYQLCLYHATRAPILIQLEKAKVFYGPLPFVHLITDIWSSRIGDGYITIDARWNSVEGEALECNLAVRKFNISHNHATIGAAITEIMVEFGLVDKAIDNVVKESSEVEEDENGLAEADAEVEAVVAAVAAVALA